MYGVCIYTHKQYTFTYMYTYTFDTFSHFEGLRYLSKARPTCLIGAWAYWAFESLAKSALLFGNRKPFSPAIFKRIFPIL